MEKIKTDVQDECPCSAVKILVEEQTKELRAELTEFQFVARTLADELLRGLNDDGNQIATGKPFTLDVLEAFKKAISKPRR